MVSVIFVTYNIYIVFTNMHNLGRFLTHGCSSRNGLSVRVDCVGFYDICVWFSSFPIGTECGLLFSKSGKTWCLCLTFKCVVLFLTRLPWLASASLSSCRWHLWAQCWAETWLDSLTIPAALMLFRDLFQRRNGTLSHFSYMCHLNI